MGIISYYVMLLSVLFMSSLTACPLAENKKLNVNPSIRFEVKPNEKSNNGESLSDFNVFVAKDVIDCSEFKSVFSAGQAVNENKGFKFSVQLTKVGAKRMQQILTMNEVKSVLLVFDDIYFSFSKPEKINKWANTLLFYTNVSTKKLASLENEVTKVIKNKSRENNQKEMGVEN